MQAVHIAAPPPKNGNAIFANIGWIWNNKKELRKMVIKNFINWQVLALKYLVAFWLCYEYESTNSLIVIMIIAYFQDEMIIQC